jgi:hypothetical protein
MQLASTDQASHVSITKAGIVALFTTVVGQVVALVPSWAPDKSHIIQIGSFAIAGLWLLANSIHAIAGAKDPVTAAEAEVKSLVEAEIKRILAAGIAARPAATPGPLVAQQATPPQPTPQVLS